LPTAFTSLATAESLCVSLADLIRRIYDLLSSSETQEVIGQSVVWVM